MKGVQRQMFGRNTVSTDENGMVGGQPSRQSGYNNDDGLTKRKYISIYHISREELCFYVKSFSKFCIRRCWLCKNYSFFCQISLILLVLLLQSWKCLG